MHACIRFVQNENIYFQSADFSKRLYFVQVLERPILSSEMKLIGDRVPPGKGLVNPALENF